MPILDAVIVGKVYLPDIWSGPILPPGQPPGGGGGQPPLGIWGPTDPRPTNPISGIPGLPGYQPPGQPPGIWGGPIDPYPDHGLPEPPLPPDQPPATPQPPHEGWNWSSAKSGWYYLYIPGPGDAGPKK